MHFLNFWNESLAINLIMEFHLNNGIMEFNHLNSFKIKKMQNISQVC